MTRADQLTLDIPAGFLHTEAYPAPVFRESCSVSVAAVGRHILTVDVVGGAL